MEMAVAPPGTPGRRSGSSRPCTAGRTSRPAPVSEAVQSGPGRVRDFAAQSKHVVRDPLHHGEAARAPGRTMYFLGAGAKNEDADAFATMDVSRINASRHNWQRVDTFQTPWGNLGPGEEAAERDGAVPVHRELCRLTRAKNRAGASLDTFMEADAARVEGAADQDSQPYSVLPELIAGVREDLRAGLTQLREDISSALSQTLAEVRAGTSQIGQDIALGVNQTVAEIRRDVKDETALLRESAVQVAEACHLELQTVKSEVDFTQVFDAIRMAEANVDFAPVIQEVQKVQSSLVIPETDFSAVLDAIQEVTSNVTFSTRSILTKDDFLSAMDRQSHGARHEVDFAPVLEKIRECVGRVDFSEVVAEVHDVKRLVGAPSVLGAIRAVGLETENLLREVREIQASMVRPVDSKGRVGVDLSQIVSEIERVKAGMDFPSVHSAIADSAARIVARVSETTRALEHSIDSPQVLQAIQEGFRKVHDVLPKLDSGRVMEELVQLQGSMVKQADLQGTASRDLSRATSEIQKINAKMDFSAIIKAVQQADRNEDFMIALAAIHKDVKAGCDLDPVLDAIHEITGSDRHNAPSLAVLQEDIKAGPDLSGVLQAIDGIAAKGQQSTPGVDLSPVLQELTQNYSKLASAFEQVKSQTDYSARFGELRELLTSGLAQADELARLRSEQVKWQGQLDGLDAERQDLSKALQKEKERGSLAAGMDVILRIKSIERRGNIRIDLRNGDVELIKAVEFKPCKPTEAPVAQLVDFSAADPVLTDIVEMFCMFEVPMVIEGHTKATVQSQGGSEDFWQRLAFSRAELILQQLEAKGINKELMTPKGLPGRKGLNRPCVMVRLDIFPDID